MRVFFWIGFSVEATRHTIFLLVTKQNRQAGHELAFCNILVPTPISIYLSMNIPGSPRATYIDGALDSNKQREANITCTYGQRMARRNDGLRAIIFLSLFRSVFLYFSSLPPQPRPFVNFCGVFFFFRFSFALLFIASAHLAESICSPCFLHLPTSNDCYARIALDDAAAAEAEASRFFFGSYVARCSVGCFWISFHNLS